MVDPVKIALHCGTLRGFGSGLVGRHILQHLPLHNPAHEFLAWVPEEWADDHGVTQASMPENVTLRFTKAGIHRKFVLENWTIRRALKSWGAQVLFSATDTTLVGCPIPHMLLVHQANLAYGPDERGDQESMRLMLRWRLMDRYLALGLPTVNLLTVQSENMANRLSQRFGFPRERITVIPSAVERRAHDGDALTPLDSASPFVTYVASPSTHKNFGVLAPMMAHLAERHPQLQCRLTVTTEQVPELAAEARRLGVLDRFVFHGRVSYAEAMQLIRESRALVMPSKLESFGLPYYEAMSEGTPVVAADRAFAREACGDAARYADADAPEAFADAVSAILADDTLHASLSEAARARFEAVARGWDSITAEYLEVLESIAAPPG